MAVPSLHFLAPIFLPLSAEDRGTGHFLFWSRTATTGGVTRRGATGSALRAGTEQKSVFKRWESWLKGWMQPVWLTALGMVVFACAAGAQTLPLPARPPQAVSGDEFARQISPLPLAEREQAIIAAVLSGNVPEFERRLCPVTITNRAGGRTNVATFLVTPDYLAVGSDLDYFLTPLTPGPAQVLADRLGCTLPTRKMVDAIYTAAEVKLAPSPIPPSAAMTTVAVFREHNDIVRTQRAETLALHPLGALVAGDKKDVVITVRLANATNKVAIYGWHRTNGQPIQPLYLGHSTAWADYSHGIRLVQQSLLVNGAPTTVAKVLADPLLAGVLNDEGPIVMTRYPTNTPLPTAAEATSGRGQAVGFHPAGHFAEQVAELKFDPGVRVRINAPAATGFAPGKPVQLILYALPNGNTIEQTIGREPKPGDDWHFDIQHIGAQTRFLRAVLTNRTVVIAYLEAESKSWPAWRRKYGDAAIPGIIERLKTLFPTNQTELVLTGHSGGGSFTFGYLHTQANIPPDVVRIAFLDSNYAYEATNHLAKLTGWLKTMPPPTLCVLAYHDSIALLNGRTFVSERGGTWGRSHAMLSDLATAFPFVGRTNAAGLEIQVALGSHCQFFLLENPERKILHTVQVERNGFIHALLVGTPWENQGYSYLGERAYSSWITAD